MRPYEVVIILDGSADDGTVQSVIDTSADVIRTHKGTVGEIQKWGRKKFAYEINHRSEGNYTLMEFSLEPSHIAELDRVLGLSDDVVRHKIVCTKGALAGSKPAKSKSNSTGEES